MGELKYFKIRTGWIKICQVSRLTWVFLPCGLLLESPENFSDSRFARGIREIGENRSVPRHFLTILTGFIPLNPDRENFGACDPGGGVLPYLGSMGTCRWKGYGFCPRCPKQDIRFDLPLS